LTAWKNPTKSPALSKPVFGTHGWVAFKGYVLAGRPAFIKEQLESLLHWGRSARQRDEAAGRRRGYQGAGACHCILFEEDGEVPNHRHARQRRRGSSDGDS
jgi:hypothetical protein